MSMEGIEPAAAAMARVLGAAETEPSKALQWAARAFELHS
jgi:hypothetical protein